MKIDYLCLVEEGVDLHLALPCNSESNSNQYLVYFDGLKDYSRFQPIIAIVGDWEYEAFMKCLSLASEYIKSGAPKLRATFCAPNMDVVSLEILKKTDQPNKLRLKFIFKEQIPKFKGAWWRSIKEGEFTFYVSLCELQKIGRIIERFNEECIEYDEVLVSSREDWVYPDELSYANDLVESARLLEQAKKSISSVAPAGLLSPWLSLLESSCKCSVKTAVCINCGGVFAEAFKWKRQCFGCYKTGKSTAKSKEYIDTLSITQWLSLP